MQISILTLFPEMFRGTLDESIIRRARERNLLVTDVVDLRDFTHDRHRQVDDRPYGGGVGMVLKPEPIFEAVEHLQKKSSDAKVRIILLSPQGGVFNQAKAKELASEKNLILICGRYEGVDERICTNLATDELSIGDYVLTGGELAALVIIDAVVRLIPGVLGAEDSVKEDSFFENLLDYPHYTRPPEYRGKQVPAVLLSGNHTEVWRWRRREALRRTLIRRPDLLAKASLSEEDRKIIEDLRKEF